MIHINYGRGHGAALFYPMSYTFKITLFTIINYLFNDFLSVSPSIHYFNWVFRRLEPIKIISDRLYFI